MPQLAELLELLYNAHRSVSAMSVEIRDSVATVASSDLVLETNPAAKPKVHWVGGGPTARPAILTRRIWFQRPDRTRIAVVHGSTVIRAAAQDGPTWWRWDRDDGERRGDLTHGLRPPPLLDLPVLHPARLLHTMWLEVNGVAHRGQREVLAAHGQPRNTAEGSTHRVEFEFDREHGTPLFVSMFNASALVKTIEVLSINYAASISPETFRFERRPEDSPGQPGHSNTLKAIPSRKKLDAGAGG